MLHEIAHHSLHALAGELAIVSVAPARIGKALQLKGRVGVRRESLGQVLELVDILAADFSLTGVEVDEFRVQ